MRLALVAVAACGAAAFDLKPVHMRPVDPQLFGLNSILGSIYPIPLDDPVLQGAVETMRVGSWRYPGGTVANYYDITKGNYVESCSTQNCSCCATRSTISELLPPGALSGAKFMADGAVGQSIQAPSPIWDLNVFMEPEEGPSAQLEYLHSEVGPAGVTHVEFGNEFYITKNYDHIYPNASTYTARIKPTLEATARIFPDAEVAVVAQQISSKSGCGTPWNKDLAATMPAGVKTVTMHDYKLGNGTVEAVPGTWQKESFVLAFSSAVMEEAAEGAQVCFGNGTRIWQTEYNYAAGTGGGFDHNHGPLFADRLNGTIHGVYLASRMLHAVNDPTYGAINFMCALAVEGIGWGGHSGIVGLDVDFDAKPVPRVRQANATGMAQIYAHLAYLAAASEGTVTMAGLDASGGPKLNVTVHNRDGLPCLQAAAFFGAAAADGAPSHYSVAIVNRCPDAVDATLPSVDTGDASYAGTLAAYFTSDPGGSAPLPPKSAAFPWPAPLRQTTTSSVSGGFPMTISVPPLAMVMGRLDRQ